MRILILGAGVGGQVVANELRRTLPNEHRVTVIERDVRHAFAPSFLRVMTGDRQPQQVTRDVRDLDGAQDSERVRAIQYRERWRPLRGRQASRRRDGDKFGDNR